MSRRQNQSRQASRPPLIKLASHLSSGEDSPRYGKWNDRAFTPLVADGLGRLRLFTFSSFSYPAPPPPPPPAPKGTWMHVWNINSISPLLTRDHFLGDILFVIVFSRCHSATFFFFPASPPCPPPNTHTCADVSNEMKVLEREVFPLTILKVLKGPHADTLEVHPPHWKEITHGEDLHARAPNYRPLWSDDSVRLPPEDYNYLPYPRLCIRLMKKQKFSSAAPRSYLFQRNFSLGSRLRGSNWKEAAYHEWQL